MQKLTRDPQLGRQLRALRLEAGFGVTELAKYMQLSGCETTRECLVKIEAGSHHVSMEQLWAIKHALQVSYDQIFSFLEAESWSM